MNSREKPMLIVHTGDGKGKSTAAFGLALRGWAQGWSIGVFQFVKGDWPTGERSAFEALAAQHAATGAGGPVEWRVLGGGRPGKRATADVDHAALARAGWDVVRESLAARSHQLYVLDEFAHVLAKGWVSPQEFLDAIAGHPGAHHFAVTGRPCAQHVLITGRDCPQSVIDAADLVTEMRKVKHPFDQGIRAQAGLEW